MPATVLLLLGVLVFVVLVLVVLGAARLSGELTREEEARVARRERSAPSETVDDEDHIARRGGCRQVMA
jgi:hypothetical protein